MVQGLSSAQIAAKLGYSKQMALADMRRCKADWQQAYENSRDEWGPRILATYSFLLGEMAAAWDQAKKGRITSIVNPDGSELTRIEPPDPRWLSGMLAVAREASTFLGLREGVDSVARVEVPQETRAALAPMTPDAYMAMLSSNNGVSALVAVTAPIQRESAQTPIQELDSQAIPMTVMITDDPT